MPSDARPTHITYDIALLIGRIMLAFLMLTGGWWAYQGLPEHTAFYTRSGIPFPQFTAPLSAAFMGLSGLLLVLGWKLRYVVLLVGLFEFLDGVIIWGGLKTASEQVSFIKDIAIVGGCLAFYAAGAGRISIDGRNH